MRHIIPDSNSAIIRKRLLVNGIVQGVGFRPFVYTLAQELSLNGFISNSAHGVEIEIEGLATNVSRFKEKLFQQPPPLAEITEWSELDLEVLNSKIFEIRSSLAGDENQTLISPDMSICPDCLSELFDPNDRRHLYPFINCTNCGPRFTIIKGIPYDRPLTTMADFELCPLCKTEYENPANRRFHAQPNACATCGPEVWFEDPQSEDIISKNDTAFNTAATFLEEGKTIAIKGLGGFHLVVDATNDLAVQRLREQKNREQKPLALMLPDLDAIQNVAEINSAEEELLLSAQRPIVLLKRKSNSKIAEHVAPSNKRLGVMLPYTPLHYIIFDRLHKMNPAEKTTALVFTSANRSEEPIVIDNSEARLRLADIADGFLMHNRDILIRADDSVLFCQDKQIQFIRRSRGYVPRPFLLGASSAPILAVGGELKNTICLLKENRAFMSQHVGDLENLTANQFFVETISNFKKILTVEPDVIVHDLHPAYFSTQWAKQQTDKKLFAVQHHHAHMASCMTENKLDEPVIGLILDGTGFGYDKTIWGCEILIGDFTQVERKAWLEPMPLPGGETAIKQPWRLAAGYVHHSCADKIPELKTLAEHNTHIISEIIDKQINTPYSSSCGRLFDAVAAMSGGKTEIHYEGQAAIEMMQSIESMDIPPLGYEADYPIIPVKPIIKSVIESVQAGQKFPEVAARFHKTLINLFSEILVKISTETGIRKIVLSGGVFQNEVLLSGLNDKLSTMKLDVYTQHLFPVNDGSIALGQAAIAQRLLNTDQDSVSYINQMHQK